MVTSMVSYSVDCIARRRAGQGRARALTTGYLRCMRISLVTGLNNVSPVESCIRELTEARDEGFARLWMTQMPYDVDLLTVLAAALPQVPGIAVASGVVPIQNQHPTLMEKSAL